MFCVTDLNMTISPQIPVYDDLLCWNEDGEGNPLVCARRIIPGGLLDCVPEWRLGVNVEGISIVTSRSTAVGIVVRGNDGVYSRLVPIIQLISHLIKYSKIMAYHKRIFARSIADSPSRELVASTS